MLTIKRIQVLGTLYQLLVVLAFSRHPFDKGSIRYLLQKQTKSCKIELRHLFWCCILIPQKCPLHCFRRPCSVNHVYKICRWCVCQIQSCFSAVQRFNVCVHMYMKTDQNSIKLWQNDSQFSAKKSDFKPFGSLWISAMVFTFSITSRVWVYW